MPSPSVSVLIPCFNHARYVGEALASVLAQTRPVNEIIVIDDGSTDGSADIAHAAAPEANIIRQANFGIGAARNAGLAAASGDIIAFVDADDIWTPQSLQVRMDRMAAAPADCVFGMMEQFLSPDLDAATAAGLHCPPGQVHARFTGTMIIARAALDRVGRFNPSLRVGEMMDWVARMAELNVSVATVDELVMRRRIHGANTVLRQRTSHSDYLRVLKASLDRKAQRSV